LNETRITDKYSAENNEIDYRKELGQITAQVEQLKGDLVRGR
ncbi:MAG: hypothetical protein JWQ25_684, partial [Daejeonella sp.]|nr:hypothetical protein [Daejeonella sp.]